MFKADSFIAQRLAAAIGSTKCWFRESEYKCTPLFTDVFVKIGVTVSQLDNLF